MAGEAPLRTLSPGELRPLETDGQGLPLFAMLDGAAVAVLPLEHYKRLMVGALSNTARTADPAIQKKPPRREWSGLSTIERDPEVAKFLLERFRGGVTIQSIRDCCRNSFGVERTPSASRIQRFRERVMRCR